MSRCFPFPPPGYESKNRPEDLDLLKEAKRKEKRHKKKKKEKKDKERKKEKEKDGSDDKQRNKKDQKEKHEDKKEKHKDKDKKDRSKDNEKTSMSVESTISAKLDEKSGEGLHPKEHSKPKNSAVHGVGDHFMFQTHSQSSLHSISKETDESKFVQELDRRIRDDKDRKSQLPERIPALHNRDQETAARAAVSSSCKVLEKGNNKDNRVNCAKMDLHSLRNESGRSKLVQNLIPVSEGKVEEFPRPPERQNEWRLEGKDKFKETAESKGKDEKKDVDKKSHGKEKVKENENKKEKVKVKSERDLSKIVGKDDFVGVSNSSKIKYLLKDVNRSAEGNIRKRKDIGRNGFLHEIKASPNKRQRPAPHESIENGSKPEEASGTPSKSSKPEEASRTPSKSSYNRPTVHNHIHADKKEPLITGIVTQGQKPSPSKLNPPAPTMVTDRVEKPVDESTSLNEIVEGQISESSRRGHLHPDSKYLADVLSVPTVVNMSENDDEHEWLFSKNGPSDKPVGTKDVCVWSEAVHIESADVCALPYVIPY